MIYWREFFHQRPRRRRCLKCIDYYSFFARTGFTTCILVLWFSKGIACYVFKSRKINNQWYLKVKMLGNCSTRGQADSHLKQALAPYEKSTHFCFIMNNFVIITATTVPLLNTWPINFTSCFLQRLFMQVPLWASDQRCTHTMLPRTEQRQITFKISDSYWKRFPKYCHYYLFWGTSKLWKF